MANRFAQYVTESPPRGNRFAQYVEPAPAQEAMPWSDVATNAVKNIPKSAAEFGGNVVHAVTHPVETVKALADVGYGGLSKAAGAVGVPMDVEAKKEREASFDAVLGFFGDRYGGVENLKRTLAEDPVGFAADLSTVLTGGGAVAARVPGVAGTVGKAAQATGRAVDPLAAGKAAGAVGSNIAARGIGMLTGAGADTFRTAAKAGKANSAAFRENMRGRGGVNDALNLAQSALGQIRRERSDAYKAGMEAVKQSDQKGLVFEPIMASVRRAGDSTRFSNIAIDETAAKVVSDIAAKVDEFQNLADGAGRTPAAMDALKRSIGEIRQETKHGSLARTVADEVYNTVKAEITKRVPEYAKTMESYADASDKISDLQKTFSLSPNAAPDTAARKLQSVMRNNVNTNYGRRTKYMEELARYEPDLPAVTAGQMLSSWTPRGLQAVGATGVGANAITHMNPYALAMLPFMSPRLMGEAAYYGGRGAAGLDRLSSATGVSPRQLADALLTLYQADQVSTAHDFDSR